MHAPRSQTLAYRPDIDGLRALAVLPVVLYHAGVAGFSGGYVGVDIFFVISGYLITGIIAREIDEKRFSVLHFYERRARRILPALFALVAAVLVAASILFLPGDFEDVPKSALAALFFAANVWFFSQTGYFHSDAETMPLLHTWSLGVEEQFYIVFPLALMAIARSAPAARLLLVWLGLAASFAWAVLTQAAADGFAFYMLPPRAWEMLVGALLAQGALPTVRQGAAREVLALLGLGLIGYAVLTYDEATVFPGVAALAPVLGAGLLIHCAPQTRTGALLSWRPAVWIGLLSYSLYLWHWPLIVFTTYAQDAPLTPLQSLAIVAASVLIAWASLRWIETPWRDRERHSRRRIFALSAAGLGLLGSACLVLVTLGPWTARFPEEVARIGSAKNDRSPVRDACLRTTYTPPSPRCDLGAKGTPDAMLWGDSHGVEFAWVLGEEARRQGRSLAQRTLGSCPPILGYDDPAVPDCARFNREVIAELDRNPAIRTVYLAAFWAGGRYSEAENLVRLEATIARLQISGRKVVLIGAVPTQPRDVPRALERAAAYGLAAPETRTRARHRRNSSWLTDRYANLRAQGVTVIDPAAALFDGERSRIEAGGKPLYFDSHHLTLTGARLVLQQAGTFEGGRPVGADRNHR